MFYLLNGTMNRVWKVVFLSVGILALLTVRFGLSEIWFYTMCACVGCVIGLWEVTR